MLYFLLKTGHLISVLVFLAGVVQNGFLLRALDRANPDFQKLLASGRAWDQRLTTPALGLLWIFGLSLIYMENWFPDAWLLVKLVFVTALSALHGMQQGAMRRMASDPAVQASQLIKNSSQLALCLAALTVIFVTLKPI